MDSNRIFENALRAKVGNVHIKLPGMPDNSFEALDGDQSHVVLTLSISAVCSNMQSNSAAFEAWLLALKIWGVIEQATLRWEQPEKRNVSASGWCHYQRFLYRVDFFNRLFGAGAWFVVGDEYAKHIKETCVALNEQHRRNHSLILNVPDKEEHGTPSEGKIEARLEAEFVQPPKEGTKDEKALLANIFGLDKVNRQFPVGLFLKEKSNDKRIFTGGASAIDLVGHHVDGSLWIFELKKRENSDLGVISELMFYASVMRDLRDKHFVFHKGDFGGRWVGGKDDFVSETSGASEKVNAVFLLPKAHTLFNGHKQEYLSLLNNACAARGIDIRFHFHTFTYNIDSSDVCVKASPYHEQAISA